MVQKLLESEPTSKENGAQSPKPDKQPKSGGVGQTNPIHIDRRSGGNYFEGTGSVTVHGDVIGGSKTETYFHGPVSGPVHTGTGNINVRSGKKKVQQEVVRLRLDAAVPEQVFAERTFDVAVAIRQPESPVLTEDTLAKRQSGDVITAWPTSSPYIHLRIQLSARECTIHGADNRAFRLYQAQDSPVFYFQLTPRKLGEISLILTVYQEDNWIGSARVRTRVQEQIVGQVKTRITSYAIEKRARLRQILTHYFDESELRNLSFDLGVDYESLPGATKGDKARELVAYFERRDRLAELIQACHGLRPDASWWDTFDKVWENSWEG